MKVKVLNTQTQVEIREMNLIDSIDRSGECLLGRSPNSGLVLDSPDVSRLHAKFAVEDGQYYFYDLGSSNGSLVNGQIVQPNQAHLLKSGDIIRLGEFVLILQAVSEQPEELAATVVGDPNATVIGLPPDRVWTLNKEPEPVKIVDEQVPHSSEVEQAVATEGFEEQKEAQEETQEETQENDVDLFIETGSSDGEAASVLDEQSLQPETIEELELSKPEIAESELSEFETLEKPELTESAHNSQLEEIEQKDQGQEDQEQKAAEQEQPEPVEVLEPHWTETSTETIDEPVSPESVEIISSELIEVDPDMDLEQIQAVEQSQEPDLTESIDRISEHQISEAEAPEPASFSESTLVQLDESENALPLSPQSDELIEPEFSSTEEFDAPISESSDLEVPEDPSHLLETESASIQPAELAESVEFRSLDSEAEFASEPTFIQTDTDTDIQIDDQTTPSSEQKLDRQFDQVNELTEATDSVPEQSPDLALVKDEETIDAETSEPTDESAHLADGTVIQILDDFQENSFAPTSESEFSEPTVIQVDESEQLTESTVRIPELEAIESEEELSSAEPENISEPTQIQVDELDLIESVDDIEEIEELQEAAPSDSQPALVNEQISMSFEETDDTEAQSIAAQPQVISELVEVVDLPEAAEVEELGTSEETEDAVPELIEEITVEEETSQDMPDTVIPLSEDDQIAASMEPSIEPLVEETRSIDEAENPDEVTGFSVEEIQELNSVDSALDQIASEAVKAALLEVMEPASTLTAETEAGETEAEAEVAEIEAIETEIMVTPGPGSQSPDLVQVSATYPDKYIALLAHDTQKSELIDFVAHHKDLLSHCLTVATPGISELLRQELGFEVSQKTPAIPPGGYQTVNSLITSDKILAVIFLRDFFTPQTTQANDEAFSRSCNIHQVMFASNLPTAEAIVRTIRTTATALHS